MRPTGLSEDENGASRDLATGAGSALEAGATPGPWRIFRSTDGRVIIGIGEINGSGITDAGFGTWRDGAEQEANARLIAAAPTLLKTLKAIEDESVFNQQRFAEDTDTDYFLRCFRAVKERARAAIALATGGAS